MMNANNPPAVINAADPRASSAWDDPYGRGSWLRDLLLQMLGIARRQFWLGLAILALALAATVVITMFQTPKFTAYSVIQVNDQSAQVLGNQLDSDTTPTSNASWDVDRFLNTQLAVLKSKSLAERVARALNLFNDRRFLAAMGADVSGQGGGSEQMRRQTVLQILADNLDVEQPNASRIFQIDFTSADPAYAANIANAYAEQFIQANLQTRYDSSAYARRFVADQLEEARVRLESSERNLNAYAREAGLIRMRDASGGGKDDAPSTASNSITETSLMQVNEAMNQARTARVAAQARWNAERAQPLLSSQTVLANPTVQALMTKRAQLQTDLATARERYLPTHPSVTSLQQQVDSVSRQLEATATSVRNSVRSEYDAALQSENQLASRVSALRGATLAEQDRSVRYNILAREADTNRQIYDGLLQRYRELNASAGIATSNIDIVDRADTPLRPSSPNLMLNLALGLLAGLVLGGLAMLIREQLDDSIRQPDEVEGKLGLPLIGVIPKADTDDVNSELNDPKAPLTEAYNSLRGALLHSTVDGLPKVLAITSAQPTEGKSTTSLALAQAFSRMGLRTVVIDADLRRPSMHKRLDLPNEHGLADLLTSTRDPSSVIVSGERGEPDLILSGAIPASASELLSSPRMAALLESLAQRYDSVIVDSPPVLGLADAPALAALTDGLVFVMEAGRVRSGTLRTAMRRLRFVDANILGVVMTKFDAQRADNRYSAYYGYDYYRYDTGASKA